MVKTLLTGRMDQAWRQRDELERRVPALTAGLAALRKLQVDVAKIEFDKAVQNYHEMYIQLKSPAATWICHRAPSVRPARWKKSRRRWKT